MMITNKLQKTKLNNKGMSLVEVIIAITILSIVIIPTLRAMTTAMTYNGKARKRQEANISAESIMEAFKGFDIESLQQMFGAPLATGVASNGNGKVTYTDGTDKEFYDLAAGGTYSWSEDANKVQTFKIEGLTTNTGKVYDINVTATPVVERKIIAVKNLNKSKDVVYKINPVNNESDLKRAALADMEANHKYEFISHMNSLAPNAVDVNGVSIATAVSTGIDESVIPLDSVVIDGRTISVDIKEDSGKDIVSLFTKYTYHIEDFAYYVPPESNVYNPDAFVGVCKTTSFTMANVDSGNPYGLEVSGEVLSTYEFDGNSLERFMLYYFPYYGAKDVIEITDNKTNPIEGYIIKQRSKLLSDTRCKNYESHYLVSAKCSGLGSMDLYHNLKQNIADKSNLVATPSITGFTNENNLLKVDTSSFDVEIPSVMQQDIALEYDLTMQVVESDTGIVVTTLNSSMIEK